MEVQGAVISISDILNSDTLPNHRNALRDSVIPMLNGKTMVNNSEVNLKRLPYIFVTTDEDGALTINNIPAEGLKGFTQFAIVSQMPNHFIISLIPGSNAEDINTSTQNTPISKMLCSTTLPNHRDALRDSVIPMLNSKTMLNNSEVSSEEAHSISFTRNNDNGTLVINNIPPEGLQEFTQFAVGRQNSRYLSIWLIPDNNAEDIKNRT